jgi:hypothetical protein
MVAENDVGSANARVNQLLIALSVLQKASRDLIEATEQARRHRRDLEAVLAVIVTALVSNKASAPALEASVAALLALKSGSIEAPSGPVDEVLIADVIALLSSTSSNRAPWFPHVIEGGKPKITTQCD